MRKGEKMKTCKWYNVCPMKMFYEKGLLDDHWINDYCKRDWRKCVRYQMEENGRYHEDWMLPNGLLDENLHAYLKNNNL